MKRHISRLFVTIAFILFFAAGSFAQPLPPDFGQPGDQGEPEFQSPIGAGLAILLGLAFIYGGKRVYDARRRFKK